MHKQLLISGFLLAGSLATTTASLACDAMGPATHMGQLMSVDAAKHTFTIRDAQSRNPITFAATQEIISGLKGFAGSLMVNYEENEDGKLSAVGVTF
ncbi:MAG TPA: hypothetical protein ENI97_07795 [Gammaproteobacteria bacterium]|nr:hypothetical protein [Gammaproteobacteria bacterium]